MADNNFVKFGIDLLPNSDLDFNLGSTNLQWNIYGNLTGNATGATRVFNRTSLTKGTNPSEDPAWYTTAIVYEAGTGTAQKNRLAWVGGYVDTNGDTAYEICAYKYVQDSTVFNALQIGITSGGDAFYSVTSPSAFRTAIGLGSTANDQYKFLMSNGTNDPVWRAAFNISSGDTIPELSDGSDLDEITDPSTYCVRSSTHMKTILHNPQGEDASSGGRIITMGGYTTTANAYQWQFVFMSSGAPIFRNRSSNTSWNSWRTFVTHPTREAIGDTTTPVYVNANGFIQKCTVGAEGYPLVGTGTNSSPVWYSGLTATGTQASNWKVTINGTSEISTSNSTTGALVVSGGASFAKDIIVNGWVRTFGDKGWYNQTHGGGLCMRDDSYVRMYGNKQFLITSSSPTASATNLSGQLIISSLGYGTTAAALSTTAAGTVAIELWRGSNASWQISNNAGTLYFKNNWTTALQTTYSQTAMTIAYNTGNTTIAGTLETGDNITIGTTSTSAERDLYVKSNSGTVAAYSTGGPNANGNRGLWFGAHGKGESITAVYADTDSNVWFNARGKGPLYLLKAVGEPWPYIRFDTADSYEGDSYTTTAQTGWGLLYCQVPAKKVSDNSYYSARFFFRVYSKTANTTTRTSHHETYCLPTATDGLSADASYDILTEKDAVTVDQGGTGVRSFTANSVIMSGSTTTSALTTRSLLNNTSVSNLGWSSSTGNGTYILTANSLAYWNGRYNSSTSNLTYCKNGEFGTIITANYPTSSTNTVFLRGDGTWTSTLAATYVSNIDGARYIIRSTHGQSSSALVMFFGENADGTTQGIYSYGYRTSSTAALTSDAKYLVYRNSAGNIFLNGNASTASKLTDIDSNDAASTTVTTERNMWFSYADNTTGRPAYDTNFTYRADIGQLTYKQWKILPYGDTYGTGGNGTIWYNGTSGVTATGEVADRVRCNKTFEAAALGSKGSIQQRQGTVVKGTTFTSDYGSSIQILEKGTGTAAANRIGMIYAYQVKDTLNTRIGFLAYRSAAGSSASGYLYLHYGWDGSNTDIKTVTNAKIYGAVWNDYAEFRRTNDKAIPGQVVIDNDDGTLSLTTKRLQLGAQVVTDTFGFAIGETDETKTPLAVSGRVLVYTYRDRYEYHAGQAVCSAPNGTVDIMSRDEIMMYPDAIVGIVSEIPEYEEWGQDNVKVNNRIWIKVK